MKFEEIQTKEDAYKYASDWHLPKVPFFKMWEFNCQDEKKCVKLAIALQSVFNDAKENNQFKIIAFYTELCSLQATVSRLSLFLQDQNRNFKELHAIS